MATQMDTRWHQKITETGKEHSRHQVYRSASSSLSPLGNASEQEHYKKALDWALKNRAHKDIKNIALTGPYGSGESTILKTYKNNCEDKDLEFLFISQ